MSPRPGGLRAIFYQKYWHIVGSDVQHQTLEVLKKRKMSEGAQQDIYSSYPKVQEPNITQGFQTY